MATNILGIGIANAIGFRRYLRSKNSGGGSTSYPGLIAAWSAKGKTNDDEDRAILKDLTGNGHDITLNGFAFSGMSGYDGYSIDFKTEYAPTLNLNRVNGTLTSSKITITSVTDIHNFLESNRIEKHKSYKIKVTGVNDDLYIMYFYSNKEYYNIKTEGIHVLPESDEVRWIGFRATKVSDSCNITIELIPEYPDALVFDGVDDYGINEDMPIQDDYTLIVKRKIGNKVNNTYSAVLSKRLDCLYNGAFVFERPSIQPDTWSFGAATRIDIETGLISWQTVSSYNGTKITKGSFPDTNKIFIGLGRGDYMQSVRDLAFYSAYLFDRSLDEQEIKSFIRKYIDPEYLLPSEKVPTPDCYYDFSQGSNDDETRDTVKDYSGNGNDAVAHNFAYSGMSGYGGNLYGNYKYHFDTLGKYQHIVPTTPIIGNLKFKVTGLTDYFNKTTNYIELRLTRVSDGGLDYKKIKEDGEYNIELPTSKYSKINIMSGGMNFEDGTCSIDIEMLPEYEGALVFDGVNDYVSLDAFDSGFKTMFMVCKPLKMNEILYDQRTLNTKNDFALYLERLDDLAYNSRNINGTYINNKFNNYHVENTLNKKQLIMVKSKLTENYKPIIGSNQSHSNFFANMALYKFLGFKEALTEEQIQAVIKKYNLLDGVDKIEVS